MKVCDFLSNCSFVLRGACQLSWAESFVLCDDWYYIIWEEWKLLHINFKPSSFSLFTLFILQCFFNILNLPRHVPLSLHSVSGLACRYHHLGCWIFSLWEISSSSFSQLLCLNHYPCLETFIHLERDCVIIATASTLQFQVSFHCQFCWWLFNLRWTHQSLTWIPVPTDISKCSMCDPVDSKY